MQTAREIMTTQVVTVQENDSIDAVAQALLNSGHHSVPVLDAAGRVSGMIAQEDLIDARRQVHLPTVITILDSFIPVSGYKEFAEDLRKSTATSAIQLATTHIVCATPDDDINSVAEKLAESHIHAVPVVEADKTLIGIVTRSDVLRAMLNKSRA